MKKLFVIYSMILALSLLSFATICYSIVYVHIYVTADEECDGTWGTISADFSTSSGYLGSDQASYVGPGEYELAFSPTDSYSSWYADCEGHTTNWTINKSAWWECDGSVFKTCAPTNYHANMHLDATAMGEDDPD